MTFCPSCHTGRLQRRSIVYLEWHGQTWLIVNRMPALVCDVCDERTYDREALEYLQQLLWSSPLTEPASRPSRPQIKRQAKHKAA